MRPFVAALISLCATAAKAEAPLPPEALALAEAICKSDAWCERVETQTFPSGDAALTWIIGGCGMQNCRMMILYRDGTSWQVAAPNLVTPPRSAVWIGKDDLFFDAITLRDASGQEICHPIWHWTGKMLQMTDAVQQVPGCVRRQQLRPQRGH